MAELADIAAQVRGETEKAYRLFDGKKTEWVPKSQVQDNEDGTFTMPLWLAEDKGFIWWENRFYAWISTVCCIAIRADG